MYRYLLHISYMGTNFRGIQKTVSKLGDAGVESVNQSKSNTADLKSVQGCIEMALAIFRPVNEIQTVLSSRTDAGVHALHSTLHVDLQRQDSLPYEAKAITGVLNRTFNHNKFPIRILKTQIVPRTFHCRYDARGRTYLYRFAIAKASANPAKPAYEAFIPVEEFDRCYFVHKTDFDISRCRAAAKLFLGKHDFRTFMSTSKQRSPSRDNPMFTVRSIDNITIKPGYSLAVESNSEQASKLYDFWHLEITGKSFLYKQVRRIVATLLAAASGHIDEKCIYGMLTIPSKNSWYSGIILAPAHGLYLKAVHYDNCDLYAATTAL